MNVINLKHDQLEINVAECSDPRGFVDGRENFYPWPFYGFYANIQTIKQIFNCRGQRKLECRLDEHLKFTGKTSDQRKCSRSALAEAYVDKRVAGKKGSTKYQYSHTSAGKKSNAPRNGLVKVRTHPLPPSDLACNMQDSKVVVLQRTVVSRFGCLVFEIWVLPASVFLFECFVFETTDGK